MISLKSGSEAKPSKPWVGKGSMVLVKQKYFAKDICTRQSNSGKIRTKDQLCKEWRVI